MSGRGRKGRSRRVITKVSERPVVLKRDEHVVGSITASMNQPPAAGQAGPSRPPEGAQVPGLFMAEQVAQIAQIVAIATRQQSQPPPPPREVLEEPGRSIERVQKLGAKPYDGSGDPEASWLWLDRVNKFYGVMGCTDEQRVLFSSFLMEDRAKDWWDVMDMRYPDGISWDQFQQEFTDRFFPQSHKDSKIEEFFKLEQKNKSVSEYEKKFSELVRLVPYIQVDEVLKCKRFLSGLQHQIRVHLSVVPQNRFGDLVEVALRVEQSTTAMYQSRQESKRSVPDTSQQSSGQYNRKKSKVRGYRGRGRAPGMQTEARTQSRVYAVTQQDVDAAPDVVTCMISILDHDAYTLVDPKATHSIASKHFLDRFQIETQPLEGRMRVSLPAGDPLFSDRVVRDSRVLIGGQEFPSDLVALDMRDFDVVLGMDWLSCHRATLDCYKKEVKLHRLGKNGGKVPRCIPR